MGAAIGWLMEPLPFVDEDAAGLARPPFGDLVPCLVFGECSTDECCCCPFKALLTGAGLIGADGSYNSLDFGVGLSNSLTAPDCGVWAVGAVGGDFTFIFVGNVLVISFNVGRLSSAFGGFSVTSVPVGEAGASGSGIFKSLAEEADGFLNRSRRAV